jgi:hypothetical protein
VGLNGEKAWTDGEPLRVKAKALLLLSTKRLDWQVKIDVPEIAVNGAVGTVTVVTPVPFTILKLEM